MLCIPADSWGLYLLLLLSWSILAPHWRTVDICLWRRWRFSHCFRRRISCPGMNEHVHLTKHLTSTQFLSDEYERSLSWLGLMWTVILSLMRSTQCVHRFLPASVSFDRPRFLQSNFAPLFLSLLFLLYCLLIRVTTATFFPHSHSKP